MWRQFLIKHGLQAPGKSIAENEESVPGAEDFLLDFRQTRYLLENAHINKNNIALMFKGEQQSHTTRVIHVHKENATFLLLKPDFGVHARNNQDFNLSLPYRKTSKLLSSKIEKETAWENIPCYLARIPERILSTEMRQFSRVHLHSNHGVHALIKLDHAQSSRIPVCNISENGFRIKMNQTNFIDQQKTVWVFQATIELQHLQKIELTIRRRDVCTHSNGIEIGFEIIAMSENSAQLLRRFIMKAEASNLCNRELLHEKQ